MPEFKNNGGWKNRACRRICSNFDRESIDLHHERRNFLYVYENDKTDNGQTEDEDDKILVSDDEIYQKNLQVGDGADVGVAKKNAATWDLGMKYDAISFLWVSGSFFRV